MTIDLDTKLQPVELGIRLLDTEGQEVQKYTVRWKRDSEVPAIRIKLGHSQKNNRVIYNLDTEGDKALTSFQFRYTNISTGEEEKNCIEWSEQ